MHKALLVNCLVDRIASRLPPWTDSAFDDDEVLVMSRAALVDLSRSAIEVVLDSLFAKLEDITRPFVSVDAHPSNILKSELYILSLAADICAAHWAWVSRHDSSTSPDALGPALVSRAFNAFTQLLEPIPNDCFLPARMLFSDQSVGDVIESRLASSSAQSAGQTSVEAGSQAEWLVKFDSHIKTLVEYISASSWPSAFEYFRTTIYSIRTTVASESQGKTREPDKSALVTLRLASFYWVDSSKLGCVIQEICSSYLHFDKSCQCTIAFVIPILVARWIARYPGEFVRLHSRHKRLDGGADTLFDMTQTSIDIGRRRAVLYPMQMSLLLLLPDVFEVASNFREAKSNGLIKKVSFLDNIRKALRNGNERAAFCLIMLLRVARHFEVESDSALVSYAMDVQDEVRDSVFSLSDDSSPHSNLDQDMVTAAFIGLVCLDADDGVNALIQSCTLASAPDAFKVAVIQACSHIAEQPESGRYSSIHSNALPYIQYEFEAYADRPACQRADEITDTSEQKVLEILRYFEACPALLVHDLSSRHSAWKFLRPFLLCSLSDNHAIRHQASSVAKKIRDSWRPPPEMLDIPKDLHMTLHEQSSSILLSLCAVIDSDRCLSSVKQLTEFLSARFNLLQILPFVSRLPTGINNIHAASSKIESVLLTCICSPIVSVCQEAISCIRLIVNEGNHVAESSNSSKFFSSIYRNNLAYEEISSLAFQITGLAAIQKRMRKLLGRLTFPTRGILDAWKAAFDQWTRLSNQILSTTANIIDEMAMSQWRNLSGVLVSLGDICTSSYTHTLEEATEDLQWIDQSSSGRPEEALLTQFIELGLQLLSCDVMEVRDIVPEALSTEGSPRFCAVFLSTLVSKLEALLAGAFADRDDTTRGSEAYLVQKAAVLVRTMVERLETPSELGTISSIQFGVLTLNLAKSLNGTTDHENAVHAKINICNLCEVITAKKEYLNMRDDVRIRNQLLEHMCGWVGRSHTLADNHHPDADARHDEIRKLQESLDETCLKTLAGLTLRLPLQPVDSQTDAGTSELKSQMFHAYFNRFLLLLNSDKQDMRMRQDLDDEPVKHTISNADSIITILTNLLIANIDVGLKHSLSIGYHENVKIRAAFVRVLYNILTQGTEFCPLTDATVSDKYVELLDLLTTDLSLSVSMSAICPATDVDELSISLLIAFEQRGLVFDLLEELIRQEVEQTDNETELLRGTNVATKMLSVYARWKGAAYLKSTLQKVVERLMLTSQDLDLELDPAKVNASEELEKNAAQLQIVAKVFMDDICASVPNIPVSFRRICSIISKAVLPRFPNAKYTAVGAFIFLRFFCPAIVAPEVEGLISVPPNKCMRRGLLLVAKVIQNLANNVLFGTKEWYMFSLNSFLVQNIHLVVGFLRDISVSPPPEKEVPNTEKIDFGSCVSLHRFLYDHWDHLQQTLVSRDRRDIGRSPGEALRGKQSILEPLRGLITSLGPPPLAITWNRPQISCNTPSLYSAFQNFMLHNAFKSAESFLTSRAVYDGGESKDGLSIVCIILRHIETESLSFDTLLFWFLKIASRLWHEPFGLFIDATSYNGRGEPSDEFFAKLEELTPVELAQNFSRIYVYNMNSAFKRCFRRLLRTSAREESSILHPTRLKYHLIGGLDDLQSHFNLSQLHLPEETISVVKETRFMFRYITRLSKSKGNVEVAIKIGSQFVQITTAKKQEILSGFHLHSVINDIFRLHDVEEIPTTQGADDSSFGLRADGGKIVMFFACSRRGDVLQTIRSAKAKQGKESRMTKPAERLLRPQDIPGTLLNLSLTNLSSHNNVLRVASYNLLGALCRCFDFGTVERFVCNQDLAVPPNPRRFIVDISQELANAEPQLTSDFLAEFFVSWESISWQQRPLNLEYVAPWLARLRTSVLVDEADGDKGREKVASVFRKLIDVAVSDHSLMSPFEHHVLPALSQDELLLDIFSDELVKAALNYGVKDKLDKLSAFVNGLGTITLRGKFITRLRKALNRSSLRPTRYLPDNPVWEEICILLHFSLAMSFDSRVQSQMFLPEIFHIVTMLADTGSLEVRTRVYKLLITSVHAVCATFQLEEIQLARLRSILDILPDHKTNIFLPSLPLFHDKDMTPENLRSESTLTTIEDLAALLYDICSVAAPCTDVSNAWRARWMSLVASTAFQNNPAIQPRAFAVMGHLAKEDVDDDLLYQVLVALRNSVCQFGEDGNCEMLIAIMTSLSKMMPKLPSTSRYGLQMFWLSMSLVRLVPNDIFMFAAQMLEAVMINLGAMDRSQGSSMVSLLLQCRGQIGEAVLALDHAYNIHFEENTFHFAVCACLVRGLADATNRPIVIRLLSTFLEITSRSEDLSGEQSHAIEGSPYLALMLARATEEDDMAECLWWADLKPENMDQIRRCRGMPNSRAIGDRDLILTLAIELVNFNHQEDFVQARSLDWLNDLAEARPNVLRKLSGALPSILEKVLQYSQSSAALKAAHTLVYVMATDETYTQETLSVQSLAELLQGYGFGGLWTASDPSTRTAMTGRLFELTEKLIELIVT